MKILSVCAEESQSSPLSAFCESRGPKDGLKGFCVCPKECLDDDLDGIIDGESQQLRTASKCQAKRLSRSPKLIGKVPVQKKVSLRRNGMTSKNHSCDN